MENCIQSWSMKMFFLLCTHQQPTGQLARDQRLGGGAGTRAGGWQRGITSSQSEDGGKKIPTNFGGSEMLDCIATFVRVRVRDGT